MEGDFSEASWGLQPQEQRRFMLAVGPRVRGLRWGKALSALKICVGVLPPFRSFGNCRSYRQIRLTSGGEPWVLVLKGCSAMLKLFSTLEMQDSQSPLDLISSSSSPAPLVCCASSASKIHIYS